jgi:hypothetical protein
MKDIRNFGIYTALITISLILASCGEGSSSTGVGGSGIGGTGSTRVQGNVATVVAQRSIHSSDSWPPTMLAAVIDFISTPVIAQTGGISGITIDGGGQTAVTDEAGRFGLDDVTPSDTFVLTLTLSRGQVISLGIGPVPSGALVEVNNIVIDTGQGSATPDNIDVEIDDDSTDNDSGDSGSVDDDSTDSDNSDSGSVDDDSTDSGDTSGRNSSNSGSG